MAFILYESDVSPTAARVRILARAKGLSFERKPTPGNTKSPLPQDASPEYLTMNPLGTIPCLGADGVLIPEAEVICEYLEDRFPTPTLRPADPAARAKVRLIARIADLYIPPALLKLHLQLNPQTRDAAAVDRGHEDLAAAMRHISHYLEGPDYAIGGKLTQADCALAPNLFFAVGLVTSAFGRPSVVTEKLKTYQENIAKDRYVAQALEEMTAELAEVRRRAGT